MAANDKTAQITGSLLITPSSGTSPSENIAISISTGTFQIVQKLTFTLGDNASKVIAFTNLGIADAHLMVVSATNLSTGLPTSVELTFAAPGGGSGGIGATNPSALVASDMIMVAYDLQDFTQLTVQSQSGIANTEVVLTLGGD